MDWIPDSLSVKLGYCFPIVEWDSALFELYSGFQQGKFPGIQIPKSKVSWITESGIPQVGRKEYLGWERGGLDSPGVVESLPCVIV